MKVLLVDDHTLFREGLRLVLERIDPSFEIFETGSCNDALSVLDEVLQIGLVLLDLALPDVEGLDSLKALRERHPLVPVVVLSATADRASVLEAINLGAMGYIPKSSDSTLLINALRLVLAKGVYVPPEVLLSPQNAAHSSANTTIHQKSAMLRDLGLTERQIEVLAFMVQGMPNKLIARRMSLSEPTVKTHVAACLRALNVNNRTQAVLAVSRLGYKFE